MTTSCCGRTAWAPAPNPDPSCWSWESIPRGLCRAGGAGGWSAPLRRDAGGCATGLGCEPCSVPFPPIDTSLARGREGPLCKCWRTFPSTQQALDKSSFLSLSWITKARPVWAAAVRAQPAPLKCRLAVREPGAGGSGADGDTAPARTEPSPPARLWSAAASRRLGAPAPRGRALLRSCGSFLVLLYFHFTEDEETEAQRS